MSGTAPQSKAEATLRALRVRFRAESWRTVELFRHLATQVGAAPGARETIDALRREAHRVHGTAGSYGFPRASQLAASLEERAIAWSADSALDLDQRGPAVEQFARELERSFAEEI